MYVGGEAFQNPYVGSEDASFVTFHYFLELMLLLYAGI